MSCQGLAIFALMRAPGADVTWHEEGTGIPLGYVAGVGRYFISSYCMNAVLLPTVKFRFHPQG
jgi:hypothetical protein